MIDAPRIIVGVGDGVRPLVWAVSEARRRKAELHVVRAWRDRNQTGVLTAYWRHELADIAQRSIVDAFTNGLGGVPRDVPVRMVVLEGHIVDVLMSYANRDDDLLVLGASQRRWRWPFGDGTVRRCVRRATCPVLVVPPSALTRSVPMRKLVRDLRRELREFEESSR